MIAKKLCFILYLSSMFSLTQAQHLSGQLNGPVTPRGFLENKGQLYDQNHEANPDVLFMYRSGGARLLLKQQGYSIELLAKETQQQVAESTGDIEENTFYKFHRVDVQFGGSTSDAVIRKSKALPGSFNYYLHHTPEEGVTKVRSYQQITYENIYPHIDIVFMLHETQESGDSLVAMGVKYNIVVKPGGRFADVQLVYEGMDGLQVEGDHLQMATSLGAIQEHIPFSYISGNGTRKEVNVSYRSTPRGVGFQLDQAITLGDTLVVDPVFTHKWKMGTYYGSSQEDESYSTTTNDTSYVYITGKTNGTSSMSTTGSYQGVLRGSTDAFMAKFNSSLTQRIWGTYYGGKGEDIGTDIAIDASPDLYISGITKSSTMIATSGAHQTSINDSSYRDAFLVKMDTSGKRDWATYYGGSDEDYGRSVSVGPNYVVMVGETKSTNTGSIATSKAHQSSHRGSTGYNDGFVVMFNKKGKRRWGTYYGGDDEDVLRGVVFDAKENIYAVGYTESDNGKIATSGVHQTSLSANLDVFLVKLDSTGKRIWGTYYGEKKEDKGLSVDVLANGSQVYITGETKSVKGIHTSGVHQTSKGSGADPDAFLARFDDKGKLTWGTYYGGNGIDIGRDVHIDPIGNILITGITKSSNGIAVANALQTSHGGTGYFDGFLAKFKPNGEAHWTTYYGIDQEDEPFGVYTDPDGYIIMTGFTRSLKGISRSIAFQPKHNSANDAMIVKFCDIIITQQPQDQKVWIGNSASLSVSHIGTNAGTWKYQWYKDGKKVTGQTAKTLSVTSADSSHHGTYYLEISNDCDTLNSDSAKLTVCSYTPPKRICKGESTTVTFAREKGASYKWTPNTRLSVDTGVQVTLSPYKTTDYTVTISKGTAKSTVKFTVTVKDIPPADAGADITLCSGQSTQLGTSTPCSGCSYSWSPTTGLSNALIANPTVSRAVSGTSQTYTYTVKVTKAGCDSTDEVKVTVHPLPTVNAGTDRTVCINASTFNLSGSPTGGAWSGQGITSASSGTFNPRRAGAGQHTISYVYTDATTKCSDTDEVVITVDSLPHVYAGKDTFFCNTATSATLKGFSPSGGTWSGHTRLTSAGVFNPKAAGNGTYTVYYTYEDPNTQCDSTHSIEIEVGNITNAKAGNDTTVCVNEPVFTLKAWSPAGGSWSGTGVSAGKFNPKTAGVGKHKLTYTVGSGTCLSTDDIFVTVNALPNISLKSVADKCVNDADFQLKPSSGGTWTGTGVSSGDFSPSTAGAGTHYVSYTEKNSAGCEATDSIGIVVNDTPKVTAFDTTICYIAGTIQLKASPSGGDWSGSKYVKANGKFEADKAGVGKYTVAYTYENSSTKCASTVTAVVEVISPKTVNAGLNDTFCVQDTVITLSGSPSGGTWSGDGVSSGTFNPSKAFTGANEVIYSVGSGTCLNRDTVYMQVNALPTVRAGNDISICENNDTFSISTGYPSGGKWSGKGIQNAKRGLFSPTVADTGKHRLFYAFEDANGCADTDSIEIRIHPLPGITIRDTVVCNISKIQLNSQPSGGSWSGHKWLAPNGEFQVDKADTGKHTVFYTFTNSSTKCKNVDSIIVRVIDPQKADAGQNDTFCVNDSDKTLVGKPSGGTWTGTGVSGGKFSPSKAGQGQYTLTYTFGSGSCQNSDQITMTVNALPTVDAGIAVEACISDTALTLVPQTPTGGYWSGKAILDSAKGIFSPSKAGIDTHTVYYHVTDVNGCYNADSTQAIVNTLPILTVPTLLQLCNQPLPITLSGKPGGGVWKGNYITNDSIYTPSQVDTHQVYYEYTDGKGCKNRDSTEIQVVDPETVFAGRDTQVCHLSDSLVLSAKPVGGSWMATTHLSSQGVFYPRDTGAQELIYTKGSGTCQTYDTLEVTVIPLPVLTSLAAQYTCEDADTFLLDTTAYSPLGGVWSGPAIADSSLGKVWPALTGGDSTSALIYRYTDGLTQCTNADTTSIRVHRLPVVSTTDTTICNQPMVSRFYGSPLGGLWSQNGILSNGSFTPKDTGLFAVWYTYTDSNGCVNRDTMTITVTDPVLAIAGVSFEMCIYDVKRLVGNDTAAGWWTGDDITSKGVFTPQTAKVYELVFSLGTGTCLTRDTLRANVNKLPEPKFSNAPQKLCTNDDPHTFKNDVSPTGGWFQHKNITDTVNGVFDPATAGLGSHTIYYHYTEPKTGCYQLDSHTVVVNGLPKLNLNLDSVLCVNTALTFPNNSASTNQYRWNFGDGSGWKTAFSPTHTYTDTGYYTMQVIGTTPDGCSDTLNEGFYVVAPPQARFDISPKKGCGPLSVSFQDRSKGRFTTYRWGFETGDTLTKKDLQVFPFPSFVYDSIIYTLELRVTNVCNSSFWYDSVTVYPTPTANIKIEPKLGCTPLPVTFRNRSYGMPGSFQYRFGDGKTSTRLDTLFQHTYFTDTTRSVYQFEFSTENICGADTQLTEIVVKPNRLRAFFELDTNQGCTPFVLRAEDHHVGDATVSWKLSDGTTYGNQDTVRHTLSEPGTYTLYQMLDNGCAKDTVASTVVVHQSPEARFTIDSSHNCQNIEVQFKNTSAVVSGQLWDFGEGSTSKLPQPLHRFPQADTFQVTLTVVGDNEFQCEASTSQPVYILPLPQIVVSPSDTSGCREFNARHLSRSTNARFFEWVMQDGSGARYSGNNISHTYLDSGLFRNQLIAESPEGCIDTGTFVARVWPRPEARFNTDSTILCGAPKTVDFENDTRFASIFRWSYGEGSQSNNKEGSHFYNDYGIYQVGLYAENRYQCSDSFSLPIELLRNPKIDIGHSADGCEPLPVQFTNNTRFADSFYWQLSDGRYSNDTSPTFMMRHGDQPYSIRLIASSKATCFDSVELEYPIEIWPKPLSSFSYQEIILPKQHGNFIFTSTSPPMTDYRWNYGDGEKGKGAIDTHRFAYRDSFWVQHFITNEFGCLDTSGQWIQVAMYGLFVPNTMLLDGSGKDYTLFKPQGVGLRDYHVEVFTTWGELVWESEELDNNRPSESWDGTHYRTGQLLDEDAYVWRIQATFLNGEKWQGMPDGNGGFKTFGTITIVR